MINAKQIHGLPDNEYHQGEGWSSTQLKDILISPAYFHAKHIAKTIGQEDKPAYTLGRLIHCMILEPEEVAARYIAPPEKFDKRTKAGKEKAAEFEAQAQGLEVVSLDVWKQAQACAEAVLNSDLVAPLFEIESDRESSWFAEDPETGLLIKCRPDLRIDGMGIIDVKSVAPRPGWTAENLPRRLNRLIRDLGYHISAAMYCHITGDDEFLDLFVSTQEGNHWVAPYQLDPRELELGHLQYRKAIRLLADCLDKDHWPQPVTAFIQGGVSDWEMSQILTADI
jgi:exodeoxyribonuclease VIII